MTIHRRRRASAAAVLATVVVASLTACGSDDEGGGGGDDDSIKVWIVEDLPDRVAATQAIVDAFTEESGIDVELVAVAEDQFNQVLTSNAAAGDLPDVIGALPLGALRTLSSNELIDTDAVSAVVENLDAETFSESALSLAADGDEPARRPQRVVGPAPRLPPGPLRRGRAGHAADLRRRPRRGRGPGQPRRGRLRRRQRRR